MASFVVMEPPQGGSDDAVLIRDGFHFWAFIVPAAWLLFNRLWIEALVVFLMTIAVGALATYVGGNALASVASLALGALVGLEAASLKLAACRRRGWREWGVVEAETVADAEIRYLAEATDQGGARIETRSAGGEETMMPVAVPLGRGQPVSGPALGMLAYPVKG